ncbi:MAG: hypothetical protein P4L67_03030 [Candidatus Pacebacteria bacterium]|nr:hypothetical protein [Candidatus Paceibacterota bacterium]
MASFENAGFWLQSIRRLAQREPDIYLVATRIDETKNRVVSKRLALQYARKSRLHYHEVSARTRKGVSELLGKVTSRVLGKTSPKSPRKEENYAQQKACTGCLLI